MLNIFKVAALAVTASFASASAMAEVNLVSNAAGAGTAGGLTATSLVGYAAERGIANIQLKDGQTGTKYMLALAEGKIDLASGPHVLPFLMGRGAGPYKKLGKEKGAELASNIQLLYPYTFSIFTLYGYDAQNITSWDDIKGKKVLNGPPKGTATMNSKSLIQLFTGLKAGDDYESVTVNWGQMPTAIVEGTADVVMIPAMFPGPRVTQASAAGAMTMISMPKDIFESEAAQKFLNKPGSSPYVVPLSEVKAAMGDGWTILSEDDMFRGKSVPGGDMVNKSMDEQLAYELTKAHIENLDAHKKIAPFMETLNFGLVDKKSSGMCGPNPVKYHKGAVRAWEEAGFKIPECAKP